MKKQDKKTTKTSSAYVTGVIFFIIGCVVGLALTAVAKDNPQIASFEEKEKAITEVRNAYLAKSSTDCTDPTDPVKPGNRVAIFEKYLQVNAYANRAVIRGCNDKDTLLYKDKSGAWTASSVNLALDRRATPKWQKECMIEGITRADTQVRPENRSIDTINFEECGKLPR